jgi:hypothetical protein
MLIEGEGPDFPRRPMGIPKDAHGLALHGIKSQLVPVFEWMIDQKVYERGFWSDNNGRAWSSDDPEIWQMILAISRRNAASPDPYGQQVTLRYYFADARDAVAFRLKFG